MEQEIKLQSDIVCEEEILARIALAPRDIDSDKGLPKDSFISLRNEEGGISFLRFNYLGSDEFLARGLERESKYNSNKKQKKYSFVGWMEGVAKDIKALAPDIIEFTIDKPEESPEHVNVRFYKDGNLVKGIVTDAEILSLLDDLYHTLIYKQVKSWGTSDV